MPCHLSFSLYFSSVQTNGNWWFWILIPLCWVGFAQGDANLLLQYNKGPDLDGFYRKWNVDLHSHLVYGHAKEDYSLARFSFAFGGYVQYKFSKTFALNSGVDFFTLHYRYNLSSNQSADRIRFLSVPLSLRVFPSRRLFFETGLLYNQLLRAENSEIVDLRKQSTTYPAGRFQNHFGWLFGAQYDLWKRINVSLQYRFMKKATDPLSLQKNNFEALLLGLHFFVLNPQTIQLLQLTLL